MSVEEIIVMRFYNINYYVISKNEPDDAKDPMRTLREICVKRGLHQK